MLCRDVRIMMCVVVYCQGGVEMTVDMIIIKVSNASCFLTSLTSSRTRPKGDSDVISFRVAQWRGGVSPDRSTRGARTFLPSINQRSTITSTSSHHKHSNIIVNFLTLPIPTRQPTPNTLTFHTFDMYAQMNHINNSRRGPVVNNASRRDTGDRPQHSQQHPDYPFRRRNFNESRLTNQVRGSRHPRSMEASLNILLLL